MSLFSFESGYISITQDKVFFLFFHISVSIVNQKLITTTNSLEN